MLINHVLRACFYEFHDFLPKSLPCYLFYSPRNHVCVCMCVCACVCTSVWGIKIRVQDSVWVTHISFIMQITCIAPPSPKDRFFNLHFPEQVTEAENVQILLWPAVGRAGIYRLAVAPRSPLCSCCVVTLCPIGRKQLHMST